MSQRNPIYWIIPHSTIYTLTFIVSEIFPDSQPTTSMHKEHTSVLFITCFGAKVVEKCSNGEVFIPEDFKLTVFPRPGHSHSINVCASPALYCTIFASIWNLYICANIGLTASNAKNVRLPITWNIMRLSIMMKSILFGGI